MHGGDIVFNEFLADQTQRVVTANVVMYRNRVRIRAAGQRFTQRQLQRRKAFEPQFLGKFNHAGLTHTGFRRQLLRAEVPGLIGLAQNIIGQLFVARRQGGIALTNTR